MDVFQKLKQQSEIESELLLQQNIVRTLQSNIEVLQTEVKQSRLDVMNAEQIVNDLTQQVVNQEVEMRKREVEFEAQLNEKNEIIALKTHALEEMAKETLSDYEKTMTKDTSILGTTIKTSQSRVETYEELVDLRRKLLQKEAEVDYQMQRFNDLLKEIRQRPFHTNLEQEKYIQEQEEKLVQIETELREEQMRASALDFEKNQITNRANELDRQNTMLIAQFSEQFLPCYYNETITEDEMRNKLDDIQHIIQANIRLQQKVDQLELNKNDDLPVPSSNYLKFELDQVKLELERYKRDNEHANSQIKRLQTSVEFYKMRWEEGGEPETRSNDAQSMETSDASKTIKRSRTECDAELVKLRAELAAASSRIDSLSEEKQRREQALNDLISQKNELIVQLHASKEALELKVQTQTSVLEDMEKRLNDIDKTNRKLDEQRIKTTSEYESMKLQLENLQSRFTEIESENQNLTSTNRIVSTELESSKCELAELRIKCESLAVNENVTRTISSTLEEFRSAYLDIDNAQLTQAKQQVESLRKDNEVLANFVKAMNVQQMFAMDKLKTTLADAQLQREAYSQECTTLKQKFNTLQLEHDELVEKHNSLSQQLVDIDTSDATLESCRKQIQQLRNKISYLEKTVAETNGRAERWNVQLGVSEKQCKTLKEITESLERNLHENEEKSLRECNRLQELCDSANAQQREGQATIESLRVQIGELQNNFSVRETQLETKIAEWKSRVNAVEQEKLDLRSQLDRLEGDLMETRNRNQELETVVEQKQVEIDDLTETRTALDDECTRKECEVAECRTEIQLLNEKLVYSDTVLTEVRQTLQSEIDSLQQKIAIFEKAQLDDQSNRQSVYENINQMLSSISDEVDQLPVSLSIPDMTSSSEMNRALEIIERIQREKKEEVNRRLQLIVEQQNAAIAAASPDVEMVSMREFNTVVAKLRNQIDAQAVEIQQKMHQISELQLLEGLRDRCDLLESELSATQTSLDEAQRRIAEDTRKLKQSQEALKQNQMTMEQFKQQLESSNATFKQQLETSKEQLQEQVNASTNHLQQQLKDLDAKLKSERDKGENLRKLAIRFKSESEAEKKIAEKYRQKFGSLSASQLADETTELEPSGDTQPTTSSSASVSISSAVVVSQSTPVTTQASVVSTSSVHMLTAEERAGRFKADVLARIQQDQAIAPTAQKRKRPNEDS